jgi:hypothetical protein
LQASKNIDASKDRDILANGWRGSGPNFALAGGGYDLQQEATMDHREQHHQHHEKQREEHKKHERDHEQRAEQSGSPIHPAWFIATGVVLIGLVVLIWTLVAW